MSKRIADDGRTESITVMDSGSAIGAASATHPNKSLHRDLSIDTSIEQQKSDDEMGEFEDAWEDEIEEEEVIMNEDEEEELAENQVLDSSVRLEMMENDQNNDDENANRPAIKAYLPGQELQEDEVLEFDSSAYEMYHAMNVEWPCLSFDLISDKYGQDRRSFPHSMYMVTGTQADSTDKNKLVLMKVSRLHRMKRNKSVEDGESSDSASDDDNDNDGLDEDPVLEFRSFKHQGGVNRVRCMPHDQVQVVASWADTGRVHIWDLSEQWRSLDSPGTKAPSAGSVSPVHTVKSHSCEGFAMDWSPRISGRLLTGDCFKDIYLTSMSDGGAWQTAEQPFIGHQQSVEDLQWSPTEDTVFASCSADQTVKIWDTRAPKRACLSLHAHQSDVNVISWNRIVGYLLASGSDEGVFSVWDLRSLQQSTAPSPAASFKWHNAPISSLEWHPTDESVLAVSGRDDQVSIWDFSVEQDREEINDPDAPDVPPQLMFIHQGQTDIKEVHWHRQIPGVLVSTAATGFNFFKTISV